ncbi:hypothetical protein HYC85_009091 [Camellia sinensis]|uniref:Uncharacterized protein n=1 Tax=Camellia sinensis TaxID=4442 RepID=A0A7J7HF82_CAMSI|nr:hypothetical protein HYC85_009091 [Camellia sinensis]
MTKLKNARDSQIACLNLTMDGLLLATASTKGTLIRIFNTMDGTKLQEVRRGVEKADIFSIALSPNVQWLAVSSDKGIVHLFSLRVRVVGEDSSTCSIAIQIQQCFPTIHLPLMLLFLQVSMPILGCYQSILAQNGHLPSFTYQNTPNSLQHLDLRTLSLFLAWMGGMESIVERFLKLSTTMCVFVFVHSMVTINLMVWSLEIESPVRLSGLKKLIPSFVAEEKVKDNFTMVKEWVDPYEDFKRSMMEIILVIT